MKPAHRHALTLLGAIVVSLVLASLIRAGSAQLRNDNGDPWGSSHRGRESGDIDGAVFLADEWSELFPLTVRSVQVMFNLPEGGNQESIEASSQVRGQIYTLESGRPVLLAQSDVREVSAIDTWVNIPLGEGVPFEDPTTFMAAVKWESGDSGFYGVKALPAHYDSNYAADLGQLDTKNLFHRESIYFPQDACKRDGQDQLLFCSYSDLWCDVQIDPDCTARRFGCDPDGDPQCRPPGFNMIRVTIDSAAVTPPPPTSTPRPTKPTSTPTVTPWPTPGHGEVYLPALLRNFETGTSALAIGNSGGEAASFALTSGADVADQCWQNPNGDNYPLWVGREPDDRRGIMRSLVRFDLGALPQDAVLLSAELRLMVVEATPDTSEIMPVYVHRVAQPWPNCPTWRNAANVRAERRAAFGVGDVGQYSVDITDLVQEWVSGATPNQGLMLVTDESVVGRVRGFVSAASTQEDLRPTLAIRYR